jgi:hemerythrin-like domain-containing protein
MPIQIGHRPDHDVDQPLGLLSDCHRRIEHFLDVLVTLNRRIAGGPLPPAQQQELGAALTYFRTAAPKHTADEEHSLFPRLRALDDPTTTRTLHILVRLEREHDEADEHHRVVDVLGRRWITRGGLGPTETAALRDHLAALQSLYSQHIAIEDRELFPAAARLLSSSELMEVGREMAARRKPDSKP